ncbi:hypothetical protein FACS1894102_6550 [Spirochaetia bacterium]|nr:hypothetical protein FACS1894102_6550 [Spirochaetia bacterium]
MDGLNKKLFSLIILLILFTSCERIPWEDSFLKPALAITSFKLAGVDAVIDEHYITVTLPAGTDLANLSPEITHTGIEYTPQNAQDFSDPLVYSVLDANSRTHSYIVSVIFADAIAESDPTPTQYTVTFDSDGGSAVSSITVEPGDAIGLLPTPTKDGYNFESWRAPDGTQIDGYYIPNGNITVQAHWELGYILSTNNTEPDLSKKFSITTSGNPSTTDVGKTFMALHNYIVVNFTTSTDATNAVIHLGDYIDLPSLDVEGDAGNETNADNGYINATNTTCTNGKLLRLIVVGINSFNPGGIPINDNDTPHIVFHFQNVPGKHSMYPWGVASNSYRNSTMRTYVTGNFLTGLINAGVPVSVLWTPSRRVASGGTGSVYADTIEDKLWLPTAWEMWGQSGSSVSTVETATNQASFASFYTDADSRKKSGAQSSYWLASPSSGQADRFCNVNADGSVTTSTGTVGYGSGLGPAPAFCVW